jgi:tetratricopeptide (TPR) repeat protein
VSKLFNTLEQIRRNEDIAVAGPATLSSAKPKFHWRKGQGAGVIILILGLIVLGYLLAPRSTSLKPEGMLTRQDIGSTVNNRQTETIAEAGNTQPADPAPPPTIEAGTEQEFIALVNRGTEYIEKGNYWQALYILDKAQQMQPQRLEPLLNAVVALVDLGLYELAVDYLDRAEGINPNDPLIKENRIILTRAGILGEKTR